MKMPYCILFRWRGGCIQGNHNGSVGTLQLDLYINLNQLDISLRKLVQNKNYKINTIMYSTVRTIIFQ